jgi:hypothetical protein
LIASSICFRGSILNGLKNVLQFDLSASSVFADGNDPHGPPQVRTGFAKVELSQVPVALIGGEPQVGEVIIHVLHGVGLVGDDLLQPFDFGLQRCKSGFGWAGCCASAIRGVGPPTKN